MKVLNPFFIAISLAAYLPCAAIQGNALTLNVEPTVQRLASGEACILKLTYENTGKQEVVIDLGYDRIGAYTFHIIDTTGNAVRSGGGIEGAGISKVSEVCIPANAKWTDYVILNTWCSTMVISGIYFIRAECELGSEQLKAGCSIEIISEGETELTQKFVNLLASPLTEFVYGDIMAIDQLASTNNPLAIPYLERAFSMSGLTENLKLKVIAAFGGIEGVDSVRSLIRIIERTESKLPTSRLKEKGIQILCKIHETTTNPEIKALTDVFFRTHQCLQEPNGFN